MSFLGIDIDKVWGDVQKSASDAWGVIETAGVPAVLGGLAQYGSDALAQMAKVNNQAAGQALNQIVNAPAPNSGLIKALGDNLRGIVGDTVVDQYGGVIVFGVGAVIVVGVIVFASRK